jgi:hypothetical protein
MGATAQGTTKWKLTSQIFSRMVLEEGRGAGVTVKCAPKFEAAFLSSLPDVENGDNKSWAW